MTSIPTGIEIFAGCGGLSTGFMDAGAQVAAGFELDRRAVDAYDYNHGYRGSKGLIADLAVSSGRELLSQAGLARVDFVIGGPPCQPFSIVGKRRGASDVRASLMDHYIRLIAELAPSAFLLENVPNLRVIDGGSFLRETIRKLKVLGYSIRAEVVSAAEFGVPQNRRRLVVVGLRGDFDIRFPEPTHGDRIPVRTAADALRDLPDAEDFEACGVFNHEPTAHSNDMIRRLASLKPGTREKGSFHDRLHPDKPSYTLRAGSGNFTPLRPIHYRYNRAITVRESARLQGFSDDFIWPDRIPRLQQYRQVGNAVPPLLARAFAECIAAQLGWHLSPEETRGDPSGRPAAMTLSDEERRSARKSKTRGASLGRIVAKAA